MIDITPVFKILSSSELPGGILETSGDGSNIVQSGTMVQPKKVDTVGGMQASPTTLQQGYGNDIFRVSPKGIQLGAANFIDAPFTVDMQGNLKALNGSFTGDITGASGTFSGTLSATTGLIGGFTITATELYGGIIKTAETVGSGSTGVIMDTAGLRGYDSVLGNTFNLPTDGSAPTFASGIINSTIFNVSSTGIMRTSATVGDGSASSAGILINDTGLYGCLANQLLADGSMRLQNTGSFFFGLPTNNLRFDGTYLKLLGSFEVGVNGLINNSVYTVATLPDPALVIGFNSPSAFE